MPLDAKHRGILEQMIDEMLARVPSLVSEIRSTTTKNNLTLASENDYIFGYVIGSIETLFVAVLRTTKWKAPTQEELSEAQEAIMRRSSQIRDVILRSSENGSLRL